MPTQKELLAKLALLDGKQDVLTAGNGININQNTDTITGQTYTQTFVPTSPSHGFKVGTLTNPDGTTADVKVPDPDIVELTQAQYDALDPSAKASNHTAYFVTDIPDIKLWLGTLLEYEALPLAYRMKNDYIFFIVPEDEEPEEPEEEPINEE